jgi:hypothetical protein
MFVIQAGQMINGNRGNPRRDIPVFTEKFSGWVTLGRHPHLKGFNANRPG